MDSTVLTSLPEFLRTMEILEGKLLERRVEAATVTLFSQWVAWAEEMGAGCTPAHQEALVRVVLPRVMTRVLMHRLHEPECKTLVNDAVLRRIASILLSQLHVSAKDTSAAALEALSQFTNSSAPFYVSSSIFHNNKSATGSSGNNRIAASLPLLSPEQVEALGVGDVVRVKPEEDSPASYIAEVVEQSPTETELCVRNLETGETAWVWKESGYFLPFDADDPSGSIQQETVITSEERRKQREMDAQWGRWREDLEEGSLCDVFDELSGKWHQGVVVAVAASDDGRTITVTKLGFPPHAEHDIAGIDPLRSCDVALFNSHATERRGGYGTLLDTLVDFEEIQTARVQLQEWMIRREKNLAGEGGGEDDVGVISDAEVLEIVSRRRNNDDPRDEDNTLPTAVDPDHDLMRSFHFQECAIYLDNMNWLLRWGREPGTFFSVVLRALHHPTESLKSLAALITNWYGVLTSARVKTLVPPFLRPVSRHISVVMDELELKRGGATGWGGGTRGGGATITAPLGEKAVPGVSRLLRRVCSRRGSAAIVERLRFSLALRRLASEQLEQRFAGVTTMVDLLEEAERAVRNRGSPIFFNERLVEFYRLPVCRSLTPSLIAEEFGATTFARDAWEGEVRVDLMRRALPLFVALVRENALHDKTLDGLARRLKGDADEPELDFLAHAYLGAFVNRGGGQESSRTYDEVVRLATKHLAWALSLSPLRAPAIHLAGLLLAECKASAAVEAALHGLFSILVEQSGETRKRTLEDRAMAAEALELGACLPWLGSTDLEVYFEPLRPHQVPEDGPQNSLKRSLLRRLIEMCCMRAAASSSSSTTEEDTENVIPFRLVQSLVRAAVRGENDETGRREFLLWLLRDTHVMETWFESLPEIEGEYCAVTLTERLEFLDFLSSSQVLLDHRNLVRRLWEKYGRETRGGRAPHSRLTEAFFAWLGQTVTKVSEDDATFLFDELLCAPDSPIEASAGAWEAFKIAMLRVNSSRVRYADDADHDWGLVRGEVSSSALRGESSMWRAMFSKETEVSRRALEFLAMLLKPLREMRAQALERCVEALESSRRDGDPARASTCAAALETTVKCVARLEMATRFRGALLVSGKGGNGNGVEVDDETWRLEAEDAWNAWRAHSLGGVSSRGEDVNGEGEEVRVQINVRDTPMCGKRIGVRARLDLPVFFFRCAVARAVFGESNGAWQDKVNEIRLFASGAELSLSRFECVPLGSCLNSGAATPVIAARRAPSGARRDPDYDPSLYPGELVSPPVILPEGIHQLLFTVMESALREEADDAARERLGDCAWGALQAMPTERDGWRRAREAPIQELARVLAEQSSGATPFVTLYTMEMVSRVLLTTSRREEANYTEDDVALLPGILGGLFVTFSTAASSPVASRAFEVRYWNKCLVATMALLRVGLRSVDDEQDDVPSSATHSPESQQEETKRGEGGGDDDDAAMEV